MVFKKRYVALLCILVLVRQMGIVATAPQGIILTTNRDRAVFSLERQRLEWEAQIKLFQFGSVEDKATFNQQVNVPLGYRSSSRMLDHPEVGQDEALLIAKNAIMEKYALKKFLIKPRKKV